IHSPNFESAGPGFESARSDSIAHEARRALQHFPDAVTRRAGDFPVTLPRARSVSTRPHRRVLDLQFCVTLLIGSIRGAAFFCAPAMLGRELRSREVSRRVLAQPSRFDFSLSGTLRATVLAQFAGQSER